MQMLPSPFRSLLTLSTLSFLLARRAHLIVNDEYTEYTYSNKIKSKSKDTVLAEARSVRLFAAKCENDATGKPAQNLNFSRAD